MTPIFLALMIQAAPAAACAATAAPPAGLEAWSAGSPLSTTTITIDRTSDLHLQPLKTLTFAPAPDRAPATGTFGGVYRFAVTAEGTYRVALGAGAWIDIVRDGKSLKSIAHQEGPPCSGIRKIVDFTLTPGRYTLQLSGAGAPAMRVLIVAK